MKEFEIRPKDLFDRFLDLSEKDAASFFAPEEFIHTACPACGSQAERSFTKFGFTYETCGACLTLFANPRPTESALDRYYDSADSTKFWSTDFYKETAEARREKLWKPKAAHIDTWLRSLSFPFDWACDIGGGYGIFAEEFRKLNPLPMSIIEPSPSLSEICRSKGFSVIQKTLEKTSRTDLPPGKGVFFSFELFEHVQNPRMFLQSVYDLLPSGGHFLFTTLSGIGADISVLGEHSKAVLPPHHLNFFNPRSIASLLLDIGFEIEKVSTPGKLDVDILANNASQVKDRFWTNFLKVADEPMRARLQTALVEMGLSSHMMAVCRKK